jgi:hypothetical protein
MSKPAARARLAEAAFALFDDRGYEQATHVLRRWLRRGS